MRDSTLSSTIGLTLGSFDIPHAGHASFLLKAQRLCDELIVGVNSDAFVEDYKGTAPMFTEDERRALIGELGYETVLNDGPGGDVIQELLPDILIVGSDWLSKDYCAQIGMSAELLTQLDITVAFVGYTPGISTSIIKERLC
jgi:cytidyltransferase-like protein